MCMSKNFFLIVLMMPLAVMTMEREDSQDDYSVTMDVKELEDGYTPDDEQDTITKFDTHALAGNILRGFSKKLAGLYQEDFSHWLKKNGESHNELKALVKRGSLKKGRKSRITVLEHLMQFLAINAEEDNRLKAKELKLQKKDFEIHKGELDEQKKAFEKQKEALELQKEQGARSNRNAKISILVSSIALLGVLGSFTMSIAALASS